MSSLLTSVIEADIIKTIKFRDFLNPEGTKILLEEEYNQTDLLYITEKLEGIDCLLCYSSNKRGEFDDYCVYINNQLAATSKKIFIKEHKEILTDIRKLAGDTVSSDTSRTISYKSLHHIFSFSPKRTEYRPDSLYILFGTIYGKDCPGCERYSVTKNSVSFSVYASAVIDKKSVTKCIKSNSINFEEYLVGPIILSELSQSLCIPLCPIRDTVYGKELPDTPEAIHSFMNRYIKSHAGLEFNSNGHAMGLYIINSRTNKIEDLTFSTYMDISPVPIPKKSR